MALAATHGFVPRRSVVLALLLLVVLSLASATPVAVVAGLSGLGALAVMPPAGRRDAWLPDLLAWLPVGMATALSAGTCIVIVSGLLRVPLWGEGVGPFTVAAFALVLAGVAVVRGGSVGLWSPASALAWLPGVVVAGTAVYRFQQPMSFWSRPVWAVSDWMSHNEMVADLLRNRYLDYEAASSSAGWGRTVYPRGLHSVLAWLVPEGGDGSALSLWEPAIAAVLAAALALTVVSLVGAALLAVTVGTRLGLPSWLTVVGGLATALLMLHPLVYLPLTAAGFLTTSGATMLLFAAVLLSADGSPGSTSSNRVVLIVVLTVGMFYLWQPLALPLAALTAYVVWRWWRGRRDRPWIVVPATALGVLACLPLGLATLGIRRIDSYVLDGAFAGISGLASIALCVAALAVVVWQRRPLAPVGIPAAIVLASLVLLGLALIASSGGSLDDVPYYAEKVLWHAGVLAIPVVVAGACLAVARIVVLGRDRLPGTPVVRAATMAVPIVLLLAYVGGGVSYGVGLTARSLTSAGGLTPQVPLVLLAQGPVLADPGRPVLPFSLHPQGWGPSFLFTDWHAAQLARFQGAPVPGERTLTSHQVDEVCDWLRRHPDAIRLTGPTLGYRELIDVGCPEAVVRSGEWLVVTTPQEWWQDTPWAETGGQAPVSPDP